MDTPEVEETKTTSFNLKTALTAISAAISDGNLNTNDARKIRAEFGISQAYFTRKQTTASQRKSRRAMQKASRKVNRGTGKGQKRS